MIEETIKAQRQFFDTGATRNVRYRIEALKRLQAWLKTHEDAVNQALKADLNKSPFETYMTEIGMVLEEVGYQIAHVRRFARTRRVRTPLAQFCARSFVAPEPYGVVLVMAPWNYPLQLSLEPLAGAVAAGNCVVLKPSAYAPQTSAVLSRMVRECFDPAHVTVVEGGREENAQLLEQRFDYIFFTGGVTVGRMVMEKAARYLTPVTLELGGKSPCIVDETADIALSARRIAFGKFLNAGQTCVAPDYVLVHKSVQDALIAAIRKEITAFFGKEPLDNENLPRIVNEKHFKRLTGLMANEKIACGGRTRDLKIEPTILTGVTVQSPVMQEEIFGPLLPVLSFQTLEEAMAIVKTFEKPLALYLFTRSREAKQRILSGLSFGGGCINDTIIHLASTHMGFGGVGMSGMGAYHGKKSFDTFTHERSVVDKALWLDLPMRYHPYTPVKERIIRLFLR